MDTLQLMRERHSVRKYIDKMIPNDVRNALDRYTAELNEKSGLHIQIIYDEPDCYSAFMAKYGGIKGCCNYISLVGRELPDLDERCGYYGELLVLKAQELGLNTCWTALSHGKTKAEISNGEREVIVISLGYGASQGKDRRSKNALDVSNISDDSPAWFKRGVEYALLAPTALNQQKFCLKIEGGTVAASSGRIGPCLKIDLGIVKCHFELAAGCENFEWA